MTLSEEKVMDIIKESNISLLSVAYSTRSVETVSIQRLPVFLSAAEHLNFTRAAEEQCISQTAVSQQIKLLEEELKTELFQRTRHSVALTSAGQVFYEYAVRITDLAEDAARRTRAAAAECSTPLEIGMMSGMENLPILEKLLWR